MDSQLAYQQAFLQNAVAQNMQIQQQLMMQNQALNQMLTQTSSVRISADKSLSPRPDQSPTRSQQKPQQPVPVYFGMTEAHRRASESQLNAALPSDHYEPKLMSKTEPNTPRHSTTVPPQAPTLSALDAYGRAKTVRIGKWRWPPAKEDLEANAEGFFEFKMRKMKHKDGSGQNDAMHDSFDDPSDEIQGLDWGDNEEFNKGLKRSQSKDSFTIMEDSQDTGAARDRLESPVAQSGNVGKLKISSEMKEKLEAAMGSRKSSVRSTTKTRAELDLPGEGEDTTDTSVIRLTTLPPPGGDTRPARLSVAHPKLFSLSRAAPADTVLCSGCVAAAGPVYSAGELRVAPRRGDFAQPWLLLDAAPLPPTPLNIWEI